MKFHHEPLAGDQAATQLWVMLPGAYMAPKNFIEAGFVEAVRRRGLPHDVALLEANIAEVADGSALVFLQEFLRSQSQTQAPRRVCLLGISLGAHLAMACLAHAGSGPLQRAAADRVASACLLAPYLGPREIAAAIAAAGSLKQWSPAPASTSPPTSTAALPSAPALMSDDIDQRIWCWLQCRPQATSPELYLGYGAEDRFAKAHALMAQALPPGHVDVQPGGHVWPVWTALWNRHLDRVYGH